MTRYSRKGIRLGKQATREPSPVTYPGSSKRKKSVIIQKGFFRNNKIETLKHLKKIDNLMSDEFWGYEASMADGDGTFVDSTKGKDRWRYILELTDLGPVKQLADLYGTSISKCGHVNKNKSDIFVTRLGGWRGLHFMLKVCPLLIEKRTHVTTIINKKLPNYHPPKIGMTLENIGLHVGFLAGALDAEGSANCYVSSMMHQRKGSYMKLTMNITNTNLRFLKKIQKFLTTLPFKWTLKDIPISVSHSKQKNKNGELCKTSYVLLFSRKTQGVMAAMLLPLTQIKRKRENLKKFLLLRDVDNMISNGEKYPNLIALKANLGPNQIVEK